MDSEVPIGQYIYLKHDGLHKVPWCLMIGSLVWTRFLKKEQAERAIKKIWKVFEEITPAG